MKVITEFVIATKPHATNPPGLARTLHRSGEEDHEITAWRARQVKADQRAQARAQIAAHDLLNNALDNAEHFLKYGIRNQIERIVLADTITILKAEPDHAAVVTQLKGLQ